MINALKSTLSTLTTTAMNTMKNIKFTSVEYKYLTESTFISYQLKDKLKDSCNIQQESCEICLPIDLVEKIRDACSEQLQKKGFDEAYNLTAEGNILESLIDKLHF